MTAVQSFRSIQAAAAHGEARTWGGASDGRSYEFGIKKSQINLALIWWLSAIGLLHIQYCTCRVKFLSFSHGKGRNSVPERD
jgi:hypothetical protein